MVDAAAQHSTDIGRGEIVYLAQLEDLQILCGKSSQTLTERVGRFTRRHEPVRWNWRLPPRSIAIESRFERLVELIQQLFSRMRPPPLVRLAIEYPEQPRAHFRPAFKSLDRLQEGREDLLRQILGIVRRKTHPPGGSIQASPVLIDDPSEGDRIPFAQSLQGYVFSKRHRPIVGCSVCSRV